MSVTINDIARICNVSHTTVIRALNNTGRIRETTKQKILDVAKALDYQPDLLARVLVKGRSMTLGVIVVDLRNEYFPKMIDAMVNEARKNGYLLNIGLHEGNVAIEAELIHTLVGYRIDGLILSSAQPGPLLDRKLANLRVPVVLLGNNLSEEIPCVGIDEKAAAREASTVIINKGYQKIVFVAPPLGQGDALGIYGHTQRLEGLQSAIEPYPNIGYSVIDTQDYCEKALAMIRSSSEKIAFLCSGDVYAGNLMLMLRQYELHPGKEYGVMGFDCIDTFQNYSPILSSVDNNVAEIGRTAIRTIIQMTADSNTSEDILLNYAVKEGETL